MRRIASLALALSVRLERWEARCRACDQAFTVTAKLSSRS